MAKRAAFITFVCTLILALGAIIADPSFGVQKKSKKKKSQAVVAKKKPAKKKLLAPKKTIHLAPPTHLRPTMTGAPGTVKSYFFPDKIGAEWKLRTVQLLFDQENKLLRADTVFAESRVVDTARFSLQKLPLMITSDSSYRTDGKGVREESVYYVDDSIAMTVFNNSITSAENRVFLVAPLKIKTAWHEKYEDTTITAIAGFGDSVVTPIGAFDSVLVTLTQQEYSDLRKFYVKGHGIVKSVFRSVGPGGRGLVVVTTDMIAFKKPD
jgi:hypothetical protein